VFVCPGVRVCFFMARIVTCASNLTLNLKHAMLPCWGKELIHVSVGRPALG